MQMKRICFELAGCLQIVRQLVDFRGHDEVILVQAFDLLCLQRDCDVPPSETDVGVMTLSLSEFGDLLHECVGLSEVLEPVRTSIRCASSRTDHSGVCWWWGATSENVSGGTPPRHGVQVFEGRGAEVI